MIVRGKISGTETNISNLKYWCQFIGSVRSGHTLVSQILNAHKDVLISDELGATNYFNDGCSKYEVINAVRLRADSYFRGGNKTWVNTYNIGYFQNKTDKPIVIGDKTCGADTTKFGDKGYLERYMKFTGLPFKFIWVLREPQQNVNGKLSLGLGAGNKKYNTIDKNIRQYKSQYRIALDIEKKYDVLRVYLENLITNPHDEIVRILEHFGLSIDEEHISYCESIIFNKPNTHNYKWTDVQLAKIAFEINDYNMYKK